MTTNTVIQQSIDNTIQSSVKTDISPAMLSPLLMYLAGGNQMIAPWWSPSRDTDLRKFWKKSDHLSGAIYTMISKLTTIPIKVVPRDMSIKTHVKLADDYTRLLLDASEFGESWSVFYSKFIEDLLTQDNGAFAELIGDGKKDKELTSPISVAHLDSSKCQRTGNPTYPVLYRDTDGNTYKLHYTRVAYMSQMTSPIKQMFGVGFSATSRCVNAAQNLVDMSVYKQEKMGSRPNRQLLITKGGLDPEDLGNAIRMADSIMNNKGMSRFAKSIAVGSRSIPNADIMAIDLASLPDGFNEQESTTLGMAVIALALGTDARELFPAIGSGATKADAIVSHLKQRGKGTGQILEFTERLLNSKFLPPILKAQFDYQDDAEDRQKADIFAVRSQTRERNLTNVVTSPRVEREQMLNIGELTQAQFDDLELNDGRLSDGTSVDILFQSDDKDYKSFLDGSSRSNYKTKIDLAMSYMWISKDANKIIKARQSVAALKHKFDKQISSKKPIAKPAAQVSAGIDMSYQSEKLGRKLPIEPTAVSDQTQNYQTVKGIVSQSIVDDTEDVDDTQDTQNLEETDSKIEDINGQINDINKKIDSIFNGMVELQQSTDMKLNSFLRDLTLANLDRMKTPDVSTQIVRALKQMELEKKKEEDQISHRVVVERDAENKIVGMRLEETRI